MNVLVTGCSGLVGRALAARLREAGHACTALVRGDGPARGPRWDPERGLLEPAALEGFDAVVHLAGENIAGGRWTPARKRRILESRTRGTRLLADTVASMRTPPGALVCASAVGWYGDRGDEVLTEDSGPGEGFLAEVCRAWEEAAAPATARSRVVHARLGLVLAGGGGLLARLRPLFALGLGGRLGSGTQYMSWISLEDAAGVLARAAVDGALRGAVNATSPAPVRNADFTRELARAAGRWVGPPVPAFAARAVFGREMADQLLFASTRAVPARLLGLGHAFRHAELGALLRDPGR